MPFFKSDKKRGNLSSYAGSSASSTASLSSASPSITKEDSRLKKGWKKVKGSFKREQKKDESAASLVEPTAPIETTTASDPILIATLPSAQKRTDVSNHSIINKLEQPHISSDPDQVDNISSDDGETPDDKLDQLRRDTHVVRSELNKIKKQSAADINQAKADHYDLNNELQQTNKKRSMLLYQNNNLGSAIEQLAAQKDQQRQDHEAELARSIKDNEVALTDLEELHSYHLQLRDSISDRHSWNEALKFKIKNHEQLSAKALAQIEDNIKLRGEQIQELKHQLSSQETKFEDIARDFDRATADLAITNQAIIDAAEVEKDLTNNIEVLQKELAEKAAEVIRLSSTVTQQNSISDELAAAYRQMQNSTSRMRSLEKAINVANDEIKSTTAADENRIRSLELDLADRINSLTSIRRLVL